MKVRAGQGRAQAERLKAYGELRRIEQVLPAARSEVIAAAEAIVAESALAEMNATDIDELKVKTIYVEQGASLRRFTARAKGRGNQIRKPTCHVYVTVGN